MARITPSGPGGSAASLGAVETVNAQSSVTGAYTIPDVTVATIHRLTLTGNATLTFPTAAAGKSFTVVLVQGAPGGWTAAWPNTVDWVGNVAPTLVTAQNKYDIVTLTCVDGTRWIGSAATNYGTAPGVTTYVSDAFNRADSASTLGSADTGQAWVVPTSGGVFGISSNQAYTPSISPAQQIAVIDSTVADCTITLTLTISGDGGPCFRETDDNNYWVYTNSTGNLYKRVAGTFTQVGSSAGSGANSDTIAIVTLGSSITVKRNGTVIISGTDAFNSTATKHGLRINSSISTRIDNFSVTS